MKAETHLYEMVYQSMLTQFYNGTLRCGHSLPSQQVLCRQYNIGITTIRKVMRMLEENGFIRTASGKRAVVCFNDKDQAYISTLLRRRESISDVCRGLEILMPSIYVAGARLYTAYDKLEASLPAAGRETDSYKPYIQINQFLTEFLIPLNNPVILDLRSDMEHYAWIPYLSVSDMAYPYTLTEGYACSFLLQVQSLARQKQDRALSDCLQQIYRGMGKHAADYLDMLKDKYPEVTEKDSYHWFSGKSRIPLYTVVARDLFKRTEMGEFDSRTYLPSVPQLMKEYDISKSTASNAIALLSDIGFVRILDKKGIVRRKGEDLSPVRLDEKKITEHIIMFLDILQILAICSNRLSSAAFSSLSPSGKKETAKLWSGYPEPGSTALIVQILLHFLKKQIPYPCLQNILDQFDDILIWGHYMDRVKTQTAESKALTQEMQHLFSKLPDALLQNDEAAFTRIFSSIFSMLYQDSREQLLRGMPCPERFPAVLL